MKNLIVATVILIIGCTKPEITKTDCQPCCLLSDKYTSDSVYKRTDTLWKDVLYGKWLDSIKAQPQRTIIMCSDLSIESRRYVIGYEITFPIILK